MPYVTVAQIELIAINGGSLPWFNGSESRGAFLSIVAQASEKLARRLHDAKRSPYSLKPITFRSGFRLVKSREQASAESGVLFEPGALAVLEVSFLDDTISRSFISEVLPAAPGLIVKGIEFRVEGVSLRVVNPRDILAGGSEAEISSLDVRFITPTYFNPLSGDQRYKVLYPDPQHLFSSLIASAHALTGLDLPRPQELAEKVYISGISIKTPKMVASKPAPNGFTGWVRITFKPGASVQDRRLVTGLLKLGEIVNVGGNRSAGYGVISVKPLTPKNTTNTSQ